MTRIGTTVLALVAAASATVGVALAAESGTPAGGSRTAVVVDAPIARSGSELVDPRLAALDAELRLPRTAAEARTNLRYFDALGYRVVAAGPLAGSAAAATGVEVERARGLQGALRAAGAR